MDGSLLTGIAAVLAVAVSVYSVAQARRVRRRSDNIEHTKVDAEAYDRARSIYESSINQLERQVQQLTSRLSSVSLEKDRLQTQVFDLQRLTERLSRTLLVNGIKIEPLEGD